MIASASLIAQAIPEFAPFSAAERLLLVAAEAGDLANAGGPTVTDDSGHDVAAPADDSRWQPDHTVRATLIRWLFTNPQAKRCIDPRGISLQRARIDGRLDLANVTTPHPLSMTRCLFQGNQFLQGANLRALNLSGSHFTTDDPDEDSLTADRIQITGSVFMRNGFTTNGQVRVVGASIGSNFECNGSTFINPDGVALGADGIRVEGHVFLGNGFSANGTVSLVGAYIGGNLELTAGTFTKSYGSVIHADSLRVGGSLLMWDGFVAIGSVRLSGVHISGQLSVIGAGFFVANLPNVSKASALFLEHAFVGKNFIWRNVTIDDRVVILLSSAHVGTFVPEWDCWPKRSHSISLEAFTYDQIANIPDSATPRRTWTNNAIAWIQRQAGFMSQPYEQLAATLRRHGYEDEARHVAIEKQHDLRKNGQLPFLLWIWKWFLRIFVGYGYRPGQAMLWGLFVIALGAIFFSLGHDDAMLTRSNPENTEARFRALVYSLDVFLPLIDLNMRDQWRPTDSNLWETALLSWYWLEIALGWLMSSVFVAGLTGLIHQD